MACGMNEQSAKLQLQPSQEILQAQQEMVETFQFFDDWTDRYQYIIDLGRQAEAFPEAWKIEQNRLHGCQSQVWIVTERRGDRLHYAATSDSTIVAGLIAILLAVYSDRRPADILGTPPEFIKDLQLAEHLSPTRSNGLHAMIQRVRQFAVEAMVDADSIPPS
jgi:cysteine desulfuration protein SufE